MRKTSVRKVPPLCLETDIWSFSGIWMLKFGVALPPNPFFFSPPFLAAQGNQKYQTDPGANGAIGHVKRREADLRSTSLLDIKVKKINDMPNCQAVNQI